MTDGVIYYKPRKEHRCCLTVKGSRFIGTLAPASTEEKAIKIIDSVRRQFPDATHNTYAYRIGSGSRLREKAFDDREPGGSAGMPMLQLLQGKNISDVVIIATRYFGGTKLGFGGLTRAYRDCARQCIEETSLYEQEPHDDLTLHLTYEDIGVVNRLLESYKATVKKVDYTDNVIMKASVPSVSREALISSFKEICRGNCNWKQT